MAPQVVRVFKLDKANHPAVPKNITPMHAAIKILDEVVHRFRFESLFSEIKRKE
jgi:hypothetical protein